MNWDIIGQFYLACTGLTAIYLANEPKPRLRRWAPVFGLLGQPAWFYLTADKPGITILCVAYCLLWARGFYYAWIKP